MKSYLFYLIFASCLFLITGCKVPELVPMKYNMGDCVTITGTMIKGKIIGQHYRNYTNHSNKKYSCYSVRYITNDNEIKTIHLFEDELSACSDTLN